MGHLVRMWTLLTYVALALITESSRLNMNMKGAIQLCFLIGNLNPVLEGSDTFYVRALSIQHVHLLSKKQVKGVLLNATRKPFPVFYKIHSEFSVKFVFTMSVNCEANSRNELMNSKLSNILLYITFSGYNASK